METSEKMKRLMEVVEEYTCTEGRLKVHYILNDGHEDEWTANEKISCMRPVAWLGAETTPSNMGEYLSMLGLTPTVAKDMVYKAYDRAKSRASELSISAPKLTANCWDCYWCMAMCIADYWMTHWGSLDVASELAYQYLSDPDRSI